MLDKLLDPLPHGMEPVGPDKVHDSLLAGRWVHLPRAALDTVGSGVVLSMTVAPRVVLYIITVVVLVDGKEEDVVEQGLEVVIQEPAAPLFLAVKPGEEEIKRDIFKANKAAKHVVQDLVNQLEDGVEVPMAIKVLHTVFT